MPFDTPARTDAGHRAALLPRAHRADAELAAGLASLGMKPAEAADYAVRHSAAAALAANLRDLRADMADRFEHVSDADFAAVEASLRRVKLAAALFASAIDAERKNLADVIRTGNDGRAQTMPAAIMADYAKEAAEDMLGLNMDAAAVLGSL